MKQFKQMVKQKVCRLYFKKEVQTQMVNLSKIHRQYYLNMKTLQKKTLIEKLCKRRGHKCFFLPKYHCELNPIEKIWMYCKKYMKNHCDYSVTTLRNNIPKSFEGIPKQFFHKVFRKVREYERAYRENRQADVPKALKEYKSHRRSSLT